MARDHYSNSFDSLWAIWNVLRQYSSPRHPLSIGDICAHLEGQEDAPSPRTVRRLFPAERELMEQLFPGKIVQAGVPAVLGSYVSEGELHVVLETPYGQELFRGDCAVEVEPPRQIQPPSSSTVSKMLKAGVNIRLSTFPLSLKCVVKRSKSRSLHPQYDAYSDYEASLDPGQLTKNNAARLYYLASDLTDGEWRIFSDLVRVYPFISENRTRKFLSVLERMRLQDPEHQAYLPSRYTFKREVGRMFPIIEQLDQAICQRRRVRLHYGAYRLEFNEEAGRWNPVLVERDENGVLDFEPYALMWSNGNYYLVGKHRGMMNLRVDRILKVSLLPDTFQIPSDFDPAEYRDRSPVMYAGTPEFVLMRCKPAMLSVLLDFFGRLPQYSPQPDGSILVSLKLSLPGVKLFALQYVNSVEILKPESLRKEIAADLEAALQAYR